MVREGEGSVGGWEGQRKVARGREWWLRDEGSQSPKGVREGGNSMSSADIRTCERTKRQVYRMFGGV